MAWPVPVKQYAVTLEATALGIRSWFLVYYLEPRYRQPWWHPRNLLHNYNLRKSVLVVSDYRMIKPTGYGRWYGDGFSMHVLQIGPNQTVLRVDCEQTEFIPEVETLLRDAQEYWAAQAEATHELAAESGEAHSLETRGGGESHGRPPLLANEWLYEQIQQGQTLKQLLGSYCERLAQETGEQFDEQEARERARQAVKYRRRRARGG